MKVAVVHNLVRGGARRRLGEQIRHLRADVVEVCLEGALPATGDPLVVRYRPRARVAPRIARPLLRYVDLASLELAWKRAAAHVARSGADVVFANPCRFLQAPGALLHLTTPSLYFCDEPRASDDNPDVLASRNARTRRLYAPLHAAERVLDRAATMRARALATNSAFTASRIERAYGRAATVLPMGVPELFTPTFESPRHLLSVGSLTPDKCHELVLRAAAGAHAAWPVLVIAPRDDADAERELHGLARELGVSLTIRTAVADEELIGAYRTALATLYLARSEPFGLVSLEAQACGSPVIAAAEGGLPETVEDEVSGMLVERTAEAAAACIDSLSDPARRARMARAAAERAAGASWTHAAAALRQMLDELAAAAT